KLLLITDLDRFRYQSIHWPLIIVFIHSQDMKKRRVIIDINHFYKANQLILPIRANKLAPLQIRCVLPSYGLEILAVMPKSTPLAYRRFVANFMNAACEFVIERSNSHDHSPLRRASHVLSGLLWQVLPPILERRYSNSGHVI